MRGTFTSGCVSSEGWRGQEEANLPGDTPEPWSSERRGTATPRSEAARRHPLRAGGACPGWSARERIGGPASAQPQRPRRQPCRRRQPGPSHPG